MNLPISDDSLDAAMSGYLVRNEIHIKRYLSANMFAWLNPGGRIWMLEYVHRLRTIFRGSAQTSDNYEVGTPILWELVHAPGFPAAVAPRTIRREIPAIQFNSSLGACSG